MPEMPTLAEPFFSRDIIEKVRSLAPHHDLAILITGETGTGKSRLAQYIHKASRGAASPFIPVDCSCIPVGLAESELFGHIKGCYTDAISRPGRIRQADGGTLFLDEVGELEPGVQAKLLKVIEEKCFYPLGSDRMVSVDFRLIAATNRDLRIHMNNGMFRRDLYERLRQAQIRLKPLRERREELWDIAQAILGMWRGEADWDQTILDNCRNLVMSRAWDGNIRELSHFLKQFCLLNKLNTDEEDEPYQAPGERELPAAASQAEADYLAEGLTLQGHMARGGQLELSYGSGISDGVCEGDLDIKRARQGLEYNYFRLALDRSHGNIRLASLLLGVKPATLRKALKTHYPDLITSN